MGTDIEYHGVGKKPEKFSSAVLVFPVLNVHSWF